MIRKYPLCLPSAGPCFLLDGENLGDYTETESVKGRSGTDVDGNKWQGYHAVHAEEIGPGPVEDTSRGGVDGRDLGDSRSGTGDGERAERDATGYTQGDGQLNGAGIESPRPAGRTCAASKPAIRSPQGGDFFIQ